MAGKYTIPLGVDAEGILSPLRETIGVLQKVEGTAREAAKEMQDGFTKSGKYAESVETKMKPITKGLEAIKEAGKAAGKEVSEAFGEKNINTTGVDKAVKKFKETLAGVGGKINIDTDTSKLEVFDKIIKDTAKEVKELEKGVELAKQALNTLDPNSEEFVHLAKAIANTEKSILEFNKEAKTFEASQREITKANRDLSASFDDVYGDLQPMTTRLGEMEDRMYELKLAGQENSAEFRELQAETVKYRQIIQSVDAAVDTYAKTSGKLEAIVEGATGIVGAFTAVQGVIGLVAGENEELEKALLKVNSAMAVLQGLQAVAEVLDKESAFSAIFLSGVRKSNAAATEAQAVAAETNTAAMEAETLATLELSAAQANEVAASAAVTVAENAQATAEANLTALKAALISAQQAHAVSTAEVGATLEATTLAEQENYLAQTEQTAATLESAIAAESNAIAQAQATAAQQSAAQSALDNAVAQEAQAASESATAKAGKAQAAAQALAAKGNLESTKTAVANSEAQVAQAAAMGGTTVASRILGLALKSIGIGLIIAAVAYLVDNWEELTDSFKKFLPSGDKMGKTFDTVKAAVVGVGGAVVNFLIMPFKVFIDLITGHFSDALDDVKNGLNVVGNATEAYAGAAKRIAEQHALDQKEIRMKQWSNAMEIAEAEGKDVYASKVKWYENEIKLMQKQHKDTADMEQEFAVFKAKKRGQDAKDAEAARKEEERKEKEAEQKRIQAGKAAKEEEKKQSDLAYKYTKDINALRVESVTDSYQQERAKVEQAATDRIEDLKREDARTKEAISARDELIEEIEKAKNSDLEELEKKHNEKIAELQIEGSKMLEELGKESKENSLKLLDSEGKEKLEKIKKQFENDASMREALTNSLADSQERKRQEIALKYGNKELDEQQQRALAVLELAHKSQGNSKAQEEQYQLGLLEIKKEGAEKAVALLLDSGKDEESVEVLNAKTKLKGIKDAIAEETKKSGSSFDMMEFLGIGKGWSKEQADAAKKGASDLLANVADITGSIVDLYQQQIDKRQESIDQRTSEIEDLESQLDKEKELREKGLANNVEVIEKEIEAKKAQRDEEIRQQKEMQEKQKQMQKAQLAIDTALQLSNMITSATSIYKSLAGIPFVGIPLAIGLIGAMFGSFALSKAKAYQAIDSGQKFEKGGWIDGNSHSQGGTKYYNENGNVRELEKDEFVTNKKSAKRYGKLLEAVNSNDFSQLGASDLASMGLLQSLGIDLQTDVAGVVQNGRDAEQVVNSITVQGGNNSDLKDIGSNISYLAKRKRDDAEMWEDETYYYVRRGSRITKTRKK